MTMQAYDRGTGRRKSAIAQVKLTQGTGQVIVNGKPYQERFPRVEHQRTIEKPFKATDTVNKYNVEVKVTGGGISGQAGAIRLGIARALVRTNENFRTPLRNEGLLTRDAREKERKKPGLKRARKAPQYTKR